MIQCVTPVIRRGTTSVGRALGCRLVRLLSERAGTAAEALLHHLALAVRIDEDSALVSARAVTVVLASRTPAFERFPRISLGHLRVYAPGRFVLCPSVAPRNGQCPAAIR